MGINWAKTKAGIVRNSRILEVNDIQITKLKDLFGMEEQKRALKENTKNFLLGKPANNALLWGEMGCGKSSLVRAVFCKYMDKNLRLIELAKTELNALYDVLCEVRKAKKYKFIIFCDDFSFEGAGNDVSELKRLLEGSIEKTPENAVFYATSNRKHLLKDQPNNGNFLLAKEQARETLSLADRFGLCISFYEMDFYEFLRLCDELMDTKSWDNERIEKMHKLARSFADSKGIRSPRSAIQFCASYAGQI